ncbi:cytochrome P450 [Diaporthe amygdali]|uniref:cytochrome P450 n=1 Tax=Phomopsis amygdali TaxID=1214568 RepID=UPI0022FDE9B8|nr:cytochrome P450 [Diaporthe amygdali]KAJ0120683.1 cytochrome P450 [Diaporthe amygdali]
MGHLNSFFKNSSKLLSEARLHFQDSREPFALTVAGQKWYVLTKPEDVTSTYRIDSGSLSYDIFAVEVMGMVGITAEGIRKAFQTQHVSPDGTTIVRYKHLVRLCKEYQLEQLTPGPGLNRLVGPAMNLLKRRLNHDSVVDRGAAWYADDMPTVKGGVHVSLYQWISDVFIEMGTTAYFGNLLLQIDPSLTRTFMIFESISWQAMYQYPRFLCGDMMRAKEKLQNAMAEYFASPKHTRADASWFILKIEEEMDRLNISSADSAIFFFQLYWSINGNTRKAPFWILSYLLFDTDLLAAVRAETAGAMDGTNPDVTCLVNVDACPRLNSIWEETIRLTAFAASVRFLTCDLEIGGKTLRKGNRLMIPQRQLHFSTRAFGQDASMFNPDRFLENPALRRHPSLRPFGGGATMCPGRNLAKQTTLAFVALAVHTFDMVLDPPNQKFPRPSEGKPSIGLIDIMEDSDLRVRLVPRPKLPS